MCALIENTNYWSDSICHKIKTNRRKFKRWLPQPTKHMLQKIIKIVNFMTDRVIYVNFLRIRFVVLLADYNYLVTDRTLCLFKWKMKLLMFLMVKWLWTCSQRALHHCGKFRRPPLNRMTRRKQNCPKRMKCKCGCLYVHVFWRQVRSVGLSVAHSPIRSVDNSHISRYCAWATLLRDAYSFMELGPFTFRSTTGVQTPRYRSTITK